MEAAATRSVKTNLAAIRQRIQEADLALKQANKELSVAMYADMTWDTNEILDMRIAIHRGQHKLDDAAKLLDRIETGTNG